MLLTFLLDSFICGWKFDPFDDILKLTFSFVGCHGLAAFAKYDESLVILSFINNTKKLIRSIPVSQRSDLSD